MCLLVGLQKDFEAWKSLFWSTLIGGYKPKRKKKMARKKKEKCSGEGKICSCKTDENGEKVSIHCIQYRGFRSYLLNL